MAANSVARSTFKVATSYRMGAHHVIPRWRYFATREHALAFVNAVHARTGVFVGLEAVKRR